MAETLQSLIAKLKPALAAAFREAMQDLRDGVDERALITALQRNDIEAAIRALNIEPAAFNGYLAERLNQYTAAGQATATAISAMADAPTVRFDMSNPRAEAIIRDQAATRIAGYTDEQVATARRVILEGFQRGDGPQNIAVDIAGRINRATGRREGGILGLSDPQIQYRDTVKRALDSGDYRSLFIKDQKTGVLNPRYTRMDGRDLRILRARIRDGKPLTAKQRDIALQRYSDGLLAKRAEDVARTETAQSVETARIEAYKQAMEKAGTPDDAVSKTWIHSGGIENARTQHLIMNDVSVVGLDTAFILPDGTAMKHTHDPAGGAVHNVNCRCRTEYVLRFG